MKAKRKPSLRLTLSVSFIIFSAVLLVILWLLQTVFLDSFYRMVKTSQVRSCAATICENIESDELRDLLTDLENHNSMYISVYDTTVDVITAVYRSDGSTGLRSNIASDEITDYYRRTVKAGGAYSLITQSGLRRRFTVQPAVPSTEEQSETVAENTEEEDFSDLDEDVLRKVYIPEENAMMEPDYRDDRIGGDAPDDRIADEDDRDEATDADSDAVDEGNALGAQDYGAQGIALRDSITLPVSVLLSATVPSTDAETPLDPNGMMGGMEPIDNAENPPLDRESVENLAYLMLVQTDDSEYLVVVESEITPVTSVVATLRIQLLAVTAIIILVSIVIAIFTARRIATPISKTTEKAKHLAEQDYTVRFSENQYRELAELNATLNYAAQELGNVDELRRELIANISHDLRTPLTMITGYSEVMRDLPGEVTPENIQIIIDEANHLSGLVSDLLDISRLESGTAEITMAPFSLTRCIESIFDRYTKLIEVDGYRIDFEQDREVFVVGDELRITQVLYNLINNAVNYVGDDKTVIVRQTAHSGRVRIDVIDHGAGIPADKLPYIWDRYYRVDKEHKQAKIGSGLGLSIVKNILKAHSASYGVESEQGKGSDFYFEMDMIDTEPFEE